MAKANPVSRLPDTTIREAVDYLADNLRDADLDEIQAMLSADPYVAMMASLEASSKAWLITDRTSLPIGLAGVAPSDVPGVGHPWLVATPGLEAEGLSFARQTPKIVAEMQDGFRLLSNHVDARNDAAIEWLLFAGFHLFDADLRHGPEERLFYQFTRTP